PHSREEGPAKIEKGGRRRRHCPVPISKRNPTTGAASVQSTWWLSSRRGRRFVCSVHDVSATRQQSRRDARPDGFAFVPQNRCRCPRFPHAAFGRVIEPAAMFALLPCYPSAAAGTPSPTGEP